jgi:hypothetical protein
MNNLDCRWYIVSRVNSLPLTWHLPNELSSICHFQQKLPDWQTYWFTSPSTTTVQSYVDHTVLQTRKQLTPTASTLRRWLDVIASSKVNQHTADILVTNQSMTSYSSDRISHLSSAVGFRSSNLQFIVAYVCEPVWMRTGIYDKNYSMPF